MGERAQPGARAGAAAEAVAGASSARPSRRRSSLAGAPRCRSTLPFEAVDAFALPDALDSAESAAGRSAPLHADAPRRRRSSRASRSSSSARRGELFKPPVPPTARREGVPAAHEHRRARGADGTRVVLGMLTELQEGDLPQGRPAMSARPLRHGTTSSSPLDRARRGRDDGRHLPRLGARPHGAARSRSPRSGASTCGRPPPPPSTPHCWAPTTRQGRRRRW